MLADILRKLKKRLLAFVDVSVLILLTISLVPLMLIDFTMVKTLVQWTAFILALAGLSVLVCRIVLPQIDLSEYLGQAKTGNVAAGLVALSVAMFLSFLILSMVLWAKS